MIIYGKRKKFEKNPHICIAFIAIVLMILCIVYEMYWVAVPCLLASLMCTVNLIYMRKNPKILAKIDKNGNFDLMEYTALSLIEIISIRATDVYNEEKKGVVKEYGNITIYTTNGEFVLTDVENAKLVCSQILEKLLMERIE